MEKYFLNLNRIEFEELDASLDDICEENEKHPANALFFLTNSLKSSHNMIALCTEIIHTKQFPKNTNSICGCNMHFDLTNLIIKRGLLPSKNKDLENLKPVISKANFFWNSLVDKDVKSVVPNLKIQEIIYSIVSSLIYELMIEDNLIEKFKSTEQKNHYELARFYLNSGKYSDETVYFFLDTFIYKKYEKVA